MSTSGIIAKSMNNVSHDICEKAAGMDTSPPTTEGTEEVKRSDKAVVNQVRDMVSAVFCCVCAELCCAVLCCVPTDRLLLGRSVIIAFSSDV